MSIHWYRCPVDKDQLKNLSQKSEKKAHLHAIGHITLIVVTGYVCFQLIELRAWLALPFALFLHGTVFSFLGWAGASHELYHRTVFKTKVFNVIYLKLFALLTWGNPVLFARSHKHHHVSTLHEDEDGEVDPNLPVPLRT